MFSNSNIDKEKTIEIRFKTPRMTKANACRIDDISYYILNKHFNNGIETRTLREIGVS
jgi:hypothetical protein